MLLKKSLEGAIKTKEKPPMKGAVSRVKPLQSWVRFDYMAYRAVYQAAKTDIEIRGTISVHRLR